MAELLLGSPLFPGESGVDQLVEIIKVGGEGSTELPWLTWEPTRVTLWQMYMLQTAQRKALCRMRDHCAEQHLRRGRVRCSSHGAILWSMKDGGSYDGLIRSAIVDLVHPRSGTGDTHTGRDPCDEPKLHRVQVPTSRLAG